MSKSNPFKLKPCCAKITVLIYGEGATEKAFLEYLKNVYCKRCNGIYIKIKDGEGGSPEDIMDKTIRNKNSGDYPKDYQSAFILLDIDKKWSDEFRKKAKDNNIKPIGSKPCIEGFFLSILNSKFNVTVKSSSQCKKEFEKKYLDKKKKLDLKNYKKIFPKTLLEKRRKKISNLDEIISVMTFIKNKDN